LNLLEKINDCVYIKPCLNYRKSDYTNHLFPIYYNNFKILFDCELSNEDKLFIDDFSDKSIFYEIKENENICIDENDDNDEIIRKCYNPLIDGLGYISYSRHNIIFFNYNNFDVCKYFNCKN